MWDQYAFSACSQLELQALEDIDKAQKDLAVRLADAREQVMQEIGGKVLMRNRQLEDEIAEQSNQVCLEGMSDLYEYTLTATHDLTTKGPILQGD